MRGRTAGSKTNLKPGEKEEPQDKGRLGGKGVEDNPWGKGV